MNKAKEDINLVVQKFAQEMYSQSAGAGAPESQEKFN